MSPIDCPECGAQIQEDRADCSECGFSLLPLVGELSPHGAQALAWAKSWATKCGYLLVVGFLLPVVSTGLNGIEVDWSWDIFGRAGTEVIIAVMAVPLAGLAMLVLVRTVSKAALPKAMIGVGAGTVVLQLILPLTHISIPSFDLFQNTNTWAITLAMIAGFGIASANHVRKKHPFHPAPSVAAGFCGIVVVSYFLLPLSWERQSFIVSILTRRTWEHAWPWALTWLAFLGYGIAGLACFKRFENPAIATRIMSVFGRIVFRLIPLSFILTMFIGPFSGSAGEFFIPIALTILKAFAAWYGLFTLVAAGIAASMIVSLQPVVPRSGTGAQEFPPAPTA